jgi:molybdate transport system ATP-binding protein
MAQADPFISLSDVSIRLHDRVLFRGLSWKMLADQQWAIVGPNGSGKSMLVKALAGDWPVVAGKIVYHFAEHDERQAALDQVALVGFDAQRMALGDQAYYQARWNIGVGEETPTLSDYLSERAIQAINPFQVVDQPPDPSFAERRQRVLEQLELVRLLDRTVIQLSNGERRKASIARAWLKNPRLLILDNPFVGLDEGFRVKLTANLENLMQDEMRVLIVTPNPDEIPHAVTHVLHTSDGRATEQGPRNVGRGARSTSIRTDSREPGSQMGARRRLADLVVDRASVDRDATPAGSAVLLPDVLVSMENVCVSYNGTPVLRQVNWTVREREQWALLGPNGAGKTTLLSLILADNPQAYANDITLFGKRKGSGESIWEIKQKIGWVSPELQLYYPAAATCLDVACSGWFDSVGLYRRCSEQQCEIALSWLHRLGLERAQTAFAQVSEGEQRLVLLARALVKEPPLIVLDEPCQGLDAHNRDRVLQAIDGVSRQGNTTMIYVTHRADELPQTITHVLRLSEGRVVEQGTTRNNNG